jgi:hypothetical protein
MHAPRMRGRDDCARAPNGYKRWDRDEGDAEVRVAKMGNLEPHQHTLVESEGTPSTHLARVGRPTLATSVTGKRRPVQ